MSDPWAGHNLAQYGGVPQDAWQAQPTLAMYGRAAPINPAETAWNFGLSPPAAGLAPTRPTLSAVAPHLRGTWDGKTNFSLWEVGRKLLGKFLRAQRQTLGTCVSRGWSLALNLLQLSMIAGGVGIEFREVAHAPIYGASRDIAGILAPPGRDGSFGGAAAEAVRTIGNAYLAELNDDYDSDKLAGQMGWKGVPGDVKKLCSDNLVADTALITSFDEAADAIWNGKPVPVCSGQGFTMQRDQDGFCRAQGRWAHCMCFGSIVVLPNGKRGLGCGQSWGQMTPSGPLLVGCPDYVFGVEESVVNSMLRGRDSYAPAGFDGWKRQTWDVDFLLWS